MLYELSLISDSDIQDKGIWYFLPYHQMLLYVMDSRNWHLNEYRIQQTQLTTTTFNILAQPVELYTGTSF